MKTYLSKRPEADVAGLATISLSVVGVLFTTLIASLCRSGGTELSIDVALFGR